MPCDYTAWVLAFDGWEVREVVVEGVVVGAVLAKGNEVHVGVLPQFHRRWCTPSLWRWAITDRLKDYGILFTKGKPGNLFIERAGFVPVREINGVMLFMRS